MNPNKPRLTLYSRSYCHLCEEMFSALETIRAESGAGFLIDVVDIDTDPVLLAAYDELVPVLMAQSSDGPRELCHYFLDVPAVRAHLDQVGAFTR